jgi:hypothetical protein
VKEGKQRQRQGWKKGMYRFVGRHERVDMTGLNSRKNKCQVEQMTGGTNNKESECKDSTTGGVKGQKGMFWRP